MTGGDVVNAAVAWIGTPYKHQHSTRGAGCDCLGLVRGVWRDLIGPEPEKAPNYSPSWGEGGREDILVNVAMRHMTRVDTDRMQSGDVLIFRVMPDAPAKHCGIFVGPGEMIHAYQGANSVQRHALVPYWQRRIVGVFRFPGVS